MHCNLSVMSNLLITFSILTNNGLLVHEVLHLVIALPFAYFLWKKTKNRKAILILFLVTIFVDVDHLVDYFAVNGVSLSISGFLSMGYFDSDKIAYIPFHAWEYLVVLAYLVKVRGWKSNYSPFLLGLTPHYILDAVHIHSFIFYSGFFRLFALLCH
jgi:hypothetical protein